MSEQSLLLVGLVIVAVTAVAAAQEKMSRLDRPIDVQSLRSSTLGEVLPREVLDAPMKAPPFATSPSRQGPARAWGLALGRIPDLLYLHCPAIQDGRGLLVADVLPGSPAEAAGLAAGQILLEVDGKLLYQPKDLPRTAAGKELTLLDRGQVVQVTVPHGPPPVGPPQAASPARAASAKGRAASSRPARGTAWEGLETEGSIAIACANGWYKIEAMTPDDGGYRKVRLEGTRQQIQEQLADLPQPLRAAICRRLPELEPAR